MDLEFWHDKWDNSEIGFHLADVNPYLIRHWDSLNSTSNDSVFVPLCGKSKDLIWLSERAKRVIGAELSQKAVEDFFNENNLKPVITEHGPFIQYQNGNITILCGDFFQLTPADLDGCRFVYDRASLIAFPPIMRNAYVEKLNELLVNESQRLLVTLEYPQHEMCGPPFSVPLEEIRVYFSDQFDIKQLETKSILEKAQRFKDKGVTSMFEHVYVLNRKYGS